MEITECQPTPIILMPQVTIEQCPKTITNEELEEGLAQMKNIIELMERC
jgi:hypothetical protein